MSSVGFVSLGCPKALVDSEKIITRLRQEGYRIVPDYQEADLVVVNTCGFIESAIDESMDSIQEALSENGKVIVTGCLGARKEYILEKHAQVLDVTGPHAHEEVVASVKKNLPVTPTPEHYYDILPPQGIKLTPPHYAYLKISEGCNHRCSFCIIPSMRGDLVSRPIDEVLVEAEQLVASGVKELLVISQDTSAYGVDIKHQSFTWRGKEWRTHMTDLAEALGELGVWVRLHYVYPYPHVKDVMPMMVEGKILPYLDVPFQHASPKVLKAMRRPARIDKTLEQVQAWRKSCPDLVIRSTFIVGFPGETEEDFQCLLDFIHEAKLERVGCFKYSPVQGALANQLPDAVPEEVAEQRYHRFMQLQANISARCLHERVGQTMEVMIDSIEEEHIIGRSRFDAPDIDGRVFLPFEEGLTIGEFVDVRIDSTDTYDLFGRIA